MVYDTTNFKLVNIFLLNFERKKDFFPDGGTLSLSRPILLSHSVHSLYALSHTGQ
jgi:hypothetical protein